MNCADSDRNETSIQKFFNNKCIFLTGGTGFFGKTIIEKLLRVTNIAQIYILVRIKKGKNLKTRIEDIFIDPIFNVIKENGIKFENKIVVINGDCSLKNLGLNYNDRELIINNVNVIIHSAATVRFNEKLKIAININVNGTKEILKLCQECKNLKAIAHVSTAFANCTHKYIEEKFYNLHINGDKAIQLNDCLNDEIMNNITKIILNNFPNTYTLTKALAENIVEEYSKKLPVIIFRPGIILSTYKEPIEGWIDNIYGPCGICLGAGSGIIRCFHVNVDYQAHLVPVDLAANALLASLWDVANNCHEVPPIYNYIPDVDNALLWRNFLKYGYEYGLKIPLINSIWYPFLKCTKSKIIFNIMFLFYHTVPSYTINFILFIIGKKPTKLKKVYKKFHKYCEIMSYFSNNEWIFTNNNTRTLWLKLSIEDKQLFFFDMKQVNWKQLIKSSLYGLRLYIAKDDPSTISMALNKLRRLKILHYGLLYTIYSLIGFIFYIILTKLIW